MTKTTNTPETTLKDKAVLVRFSDRVWQGGMVDRKVSKEVEETHKAKINTGHYWKRLVPKAAIRPRANAGNAARNFHISNTLPWMDGGTRILPVANFEAYMAGIRKLMSAAQKEEKKLFADYSAWIDEAKRSHGSLFNPDHYPTLAELKTKFGIDIDVLPLPNVSDWRVDLSTEQVKTMKAHAEEKMNDIHREGLVELYSRLDEMLEKANERLSDPEATFRDSLIKNIRELVELLPRMNISGDKHLEAIRKEVEEKISKTSPEDLRLDPAKRSKVAKASADIRKKMAAFMTTK